MDAPSTIVRDGNFVVVTNAFGTFYLNVESIRQIPRGGYFQTVIGHQGEPPVHVTTPPGHVNHETTTVVIPAVVEEERQDADSTTTSTDQ